MGGYPTFDKDMDLAKKLLDGKFHEEDDDEIDSNVVNNNK